MAIRNATDMTNECNSSENMAEAISRTNELTTTNRHAC